ncbi:helix-turn-helix domain-containing protein [Altererythrobacter fulvus]|uniref:helix-turn-helix domain-containing protein n=1 Tax=Caenibius fulvus TaxID=2126012 RepID=UPI0030190E56
MGKGADLARYGLYGEHEGPPAPEFLHIELISARASLYEWEISAHSHSTLHQIILLDEGTGMLHADEEEVPLAPHSLIAIPSQCIHSLHFAPGSEGWVLSFAVEMLHDPRLGQSAQASALARPAATIARLLADGSDLTRLRWIMGAIATDLATAISGGLSNVLVAEFGLLLAASDALLGRQGDARPALTRQEALARDFRRLVDKGFDRDWPVSRYARELGSSEPTLTRACRTVFGKAPGEVIQARLLLEAMRYLTYSNGSISQIAGRLGFSDPAYFARFFKSKAGVTASEFRRQRRWASNEGRG